MLQRADAMIDLFPTRYSITIKARAHAEYLKELHAYYNEHDWTARMYEPSQICLHEFQYWKIYGKPTGKGYILRTRDFLRRHPTLAGLPFSIIYF